MPADSTLIRKRYPFLSFRQSQTSMICLALKTQHEGDRGGQKTIRVQAHSFTNAVIAKVLMKAHKREVDVEVILDKSQWTDKYSSATSLANVGRSANASRFPSLALLLRPSGELRKVSRECSQNHLFRTLGAFRRAPELADVING